MEYFFNKKKNVKIMLFIVLIWVISILIIQPNINFPVGDDWSYARSVKNLLETGKLQFTGWTSMPLAAQTIWGALFAWIFGFSHIVLRYSVLVLAIFGALGLFSIFKKINLLKPIENMVLVLVLIFHPFFIHFAYTFATDIPFAVFIIFSILFIIKYFQNGKLQNYLLGISFCLVAGLIRDLSLALPPAFAITLFFNKGINKKTIFSASFFIIIIAAEWIGFRLWLEASQGGLPALYDDGRVRMAQTLALPVWKFSAHIIKNTFVILSFLAFYSLPVSIIIFQKYFKILKHNKTVWGLALSFSLISAVLCLKAGLAYFLTEFIYAGAAMPNAIAIQKSEAFLPNPFLNAIVLLISVISSFIFTFVVGLIIKDYKKSDKLIKTIVLFLFTVSIVYCFPILIAGPFNRYLIIPLFLFVFVCSIYLKSDQKSKVFNKLSIVVSIAYIYIGFAGAYDMMQMIRARSEAVKELESKGIRPETIDGGFEYNGWHFYDNKYSVKPGKNWWWVVGDEYAVLNGIPKDSKIISQRKYTRLFPPFYNGFIYAVKRK